MATVRILMAALFLNAPLWAQDPPVRALARPEAFSESFDQVFALRELASGKILLVDNGPRLLYLIDFPAGQRTTIGRKGQGPGEYQFPSGLVPFLGDTTLLLDRMTRRLLPIAADGKMGKVIALPETTSDITSIRGADRQGRLFLQAELFGSTGKAEDDFRRPTSAVILRWDRSAGHLDTITTIRLPASSTAIRAAGNSRAMSLHQQPYGGQDEWVVGHDGQVGVVRVGDYHVEWRGERVVSGPAVRHEPVPVGQAEKDAFMAPLLEQRSRSAMGNAGRAPAVRPPPMTADEFDWPRAKPPFVAGNVFVAPEGDLWVQRSLPARDPVPVYDVFNASGNLTARISLPTGRRLVGLGSGVAYATRTDDDGLQWLERYKR